MRDKRVFLASAIALLSAPLVVCTALAQESGDRQPTDSQQTQSQRDTQVQPQRDAQMQRDRSDTAEATVEARRQVAQATRVVERMKREPQLLQLMKQAQGIFVAPDFGQGAAVIGARGGRGVLLVRQGDDWSSPAFYNFGAISIGPQAGGSAGSFAMLLMDDRAVTSFRDNENTFSLDANAGLTIADYSAEDQGSAGKGNVVVWADTEGLFAGVSIAVSNISRDEDRNRAYYQRQVTMPQLLSGSVTNPDARALQEALPDRVATRE